MKKMRRFEHLYLMTMLSFSISQNVQAQEYPRTEVFNSKKVTAGAFIDTYFARDFNNPKGDRPYTTQALVEDEARINLGFVDIKLDSTNWRGRLAAQGGDSVRANYAAESDLFVRYVQEGTLGYKISDKLWIDAGIYLSHIGLESFNSRDDWNYTRSLVAEYSPYYESGVKLSYQYDNNWSAQIHLIRGWQNISANENMALGMQVAWTPQETLQFTYNNFIGDVNGLRVFNELLAKIDVSKKLSFAAQFDLGNQHRIENDDNVWWFGWAFLSKYKINDKTSVGSRAEKYKDPHQVLVSSASSESFDTIGLSANIDYQIASNLFWRNEYKVYLGGHDIFPKGENFKSSDQLIVTSLSYSF